MNPTTIFSKDIGINDENELFALKEKTGWLYNVCEVLEYTNIVGRRLAELSTIANNSGKINTNETIEINSVLLTILIYFDSFDDLFYFPQKNKKHPFVNKNIFQWKLSKPFKNSTYKLLNGMRNALVHRHPINMRFMRFFGDNNRIGLALSPFEFKYFIQVSPKMLDNSRKRRNIKFIREEPFDTTYNFFGSWFAWDHGKTSCYLDCEDLGKGIFDFLFNLFLDVVNRNDDNIREFLILVRKIGTLHVYLKEKDSYYDVCSGFHVIKPFLKCIIRKINEPIFNPTRNFR